MKFPQSEEPPEIKVSPEHREYLVQLGLHVILTSYGLSLLRAPTESDILDLIDMTLTYFRKLAPMGDAILNDEPMYLAGEILGRTAQSLDEAPDAFWANYHTISATVTREWANRGEFLATIGGAVSGRSDRASSEFVVEIVSA